MKSNIIILALVLTLCVVVEAQDRNSLRGQQRGIGAGQAFLELFKNDINKDGKISRDELPEDRKQLISDYDSNGDGAISKSEARLVAPANQIDRSRSRVRGRGDARRESSRSASRRPPGRLRESSRRPGSSSSRSGGLFFQVFDVDKDGEISLDEIKDASKALMKLDVNGDKRLSRREVWGHSPSDLGQRRASGIGRGQENSNSESGRDRFVSRIFENDKNNDGKVTIEEIPDRMSELFETGDLDDDGALSRREIDAIYYRMSQRDPRRRERDDRSFSGRRPRN